MKKELDPIAQQLQQIFNLLFAHFGAQQWWPGDSRWEIMVGAVLTQNTSWRNVEKAIAKLKQAQCLDPARLRALRTPRLAQLIRSSGYYNGKAKKLKALVKFLFDHYDGDPARMVQPPVQTLQQQRAALLNVYGIGPETADCILLYAAEQPIFVVDAYTRRIFARLGFTDAYASYDELQQLFMQHLPPNVALFNEYHALLVILGKDICTKRAPRCHACPLNRGCEKRGVEREESVDIKG